MVQIKTFTFNPFAENTFVLYDDTQEAIVIDAGCYTPQEQNTLVQFIEEQALQVTALVNTHCHVDHVLGVRFLQEKYKVPFKAHEAERLNFSEMVLGRVKAQGFGFFYAINIDHMITEHDTITFGKTSLQIRFTPGHSPGHVVFIHEEQGFCINGDVLFRGSIGRTDLPGGNHEQLLRSIQTQLFILPDDMRILTGHGPETTVGFEKQHNPFF
ncbi:MAG: MBL fold metallo-hydrolase [Thermonemataceae bacterium]